LGSSRDEASMHGMATHTGTRHDARWLPQSRVGRWVVAPAGFTVGGIGLQVLGLATGPVESTESDTAGRVNAGWALLPVALPVSDIAVGKFFPVRRRPQTTRGRRPR
jgi:hypothetical protein